MIVPFACVMLCVFVGTFLLGSIPWGVVVSRLFFHTDVREHGSGNIGTTNSFRALGKMGGACVFLLDFGKGLLSGLAASWVCLWLASTGDFDVSTYQIIMALAFLGCVWGHVFSPWLHFKGGKGIAVAVGCEFVVLGIWPALLEIALFALLVVITRRVSVGSLAAAVLCPILAAIVFWGHWLAWLLVTLAAVTVIWAHRGNIERLLAGTESTIGSKKKERS